MNALSEQNLFILRGLTVGAYVFLPLIACKHETRCVSITVGSMPWGTMPGTEMVLSQSLLSKP